MMTNIIKTTNHSVSIVDASIDAALFDRFIRFVDASEKTIQTYRRALKQFGYYISDNGIRQPHREDVTAWRDSLKEQGKAPATIQLYVTAVRLFFQWTASEHIYPNIAEHLKGARLSRDHKKDYLTAQQAKTVLSAIDVTTEQGARNYAMAALMLSCGLRTIEVSRADIADLRPLGGFTVLYIQGKGKTEKADYVKIPAVIETAIRDYLKIRGANKGPLFAGTSNRSSQDGRMTTRAISGAIKGLLKAAGFDSDRLTAHSLRHTAVTLSLLSGCSLEEAQQFARHSNIQTTMIYNHALEKAKNPCSEAVSNALF